MGAEQRLYLVDDDDALREALAGRLRLAAYGVETFASGYRFLESVPLDAPGCVILDLRMPGLSGLELFRMMVERGSTLPVIFLTGYGDIATTVEAVRLGAVDLLEKPVATARLLATIEEGLARDREARQRRRARRLMPTGKGKPSRIGTGVTVRRNQVR